MHAEGVVLLLGSAADDVVAQQDTHNCGVLSYRWIEQRVCNSVINYTTLDVAYLRRLLQVELVHGRPMRLIQDAEWSTTSLTKATLRSSFATLAGICRDTEWSAQSLANPVAESAPVMTIGNVGSLKKLCATSEQAMRIHTNILLQELSLRIHCQKGSSQNAVTMPPWASHASLSATLSVALSR